MAVPKDARFCGAISVGVGQTVAEVHADGAGIYISQVRANGMRGTTVTIPMEKAAFFERAIVNAIKGE